MNNKCSISDETLQLIDTWFSKYEFETHVKTYNKSYDESKDPTHFLITCSKCKTKFNKKFFNKELQKIIKKNIGTDLDPISFQNFLY